MRSLSVSSHDNTRIAPSILVVWVSDLSVVLTSSQVRTWESCSREAEARAVEVEAEARAEAEAVEARAEAVVVEARAVEAEGRGRGMQADGLPRQGIHPVVIGATPRLVVAAASPDVVSSASQVQLT
jgi:putative heme iron utilization protein